MDASTNWVQGMEQPKGEDRIKSECWEVLPPAVAVTDRNDKSDDGDEGVLVLVMTPSLPPMHTFLDKLVNNEPLGAISNDDPSGFGFFDTVPVVSSSCVKH
ncbi:hypothetical protein [Sporisorium scitamineum]|uniref:Uncharacterized protein n=1 Tax=Sporisorium scitamineum TaxID=49012 RepID=A0A0F7S1V7_9BASI|nr:hypothetical protein [Sporisorium scitamineum]